jgi:hypothetical protein
MNIKSHGVTTLTGKNQRSQKKACPSATCSITNPKCNNLDVNPSLRGVSPETNCLSYLRLAFHFSFTGEKHPFRPIYVYANNKTIKARNCTFTVHNYDLLMAIMDPSFTAPYSALYQ